MKERHKILIVDDDANLRKTLVDILAVKGYAVTAVATGKEALSAVKEDPPAVALIDLKLEDIPGLELMKQLKERCSQTEFIVITGHATKKTAIEAVNLGAYSYLERPCDMEQLFLCIRRVVEKVQLQKQVQEKHQELQAILDTIPSMVFYKDTNGEVIYVNKALANCLKMPREEIIGKTTDKLFPRQAQAMKRDDREVIASGRPKTKITEPYQTAEGVHWAQTDKLPYVDSDGNVVGVIGIATDITERKRMEETLRESEELFKQTFNHQLDAIFILDSANSPKILDCNPAATKVFGYSREEMLGRTTAFLHVDETHLRRFWEQVYPAIEEDGFLYLTEFEMRRKDGTVFPSEHSVVPLQDAQGERTGWVSVVRDITEQKRAEERLQRTLQGTIEAVGLTTETRDPYTSIHQQEVTRLACAIAGELELPDEQIEGLRAAGLIHDIGKLSIPAEILSKPTELTDMEYELIKAHPQTAYDILKGIDFPWPVADIVRQHHERLDGSGYPNGLKGDEILLEARILAIADVVEAMASHRPYRPALGIDRALEEIGKNKGKLYDPRAVDACLKLFADGRFEFGS